MEYTYKELADKWRCSIRTARRRVEQAGYKTEEKIVLVKQHQKVVFITLED